MAESGREPGSALSLSEPQSSAKSPETWASLETTLSLCYPHLVSGSTNTL